MGCPTETDSMVESPLLGICLKADLRAPTPRVATEQADPSAELLHLLTREFSLKSRPRPHKDRYIAPTCVIRIFW